MTELFSHLIPVGVAILTILFSIIGFLLIKDNKNLTTRIDKNELALKELEERINNKISVGYKEILIAIKEVTSNTVTLRHCDEKQILWGERFDSWHRTQELLSKSDAAAHERIISTMIGMTDHIEKLAKCIADMQLKRECES